MKKNITLIKSLKNYDQGCFDSLKQQIPNLIEYSSNKLNMKNSFNLQNHKRSTYKSISDNFFLSVKGSLDNLEEYEKKIRSKENVLGNNNIIEMFPMLEQKIPYQCLLTELIEEFELSIDFIGKYIVQFNKIPNIPIPLSIYKYNGEYQNDIIKTLKKNISRFLSPHIDKIMLNDSLGVIEYLYPMSPFRLMDLKERDRRVQISWNEDFSIIFSWCDLFIDSIIVGYMPTSKYSILKGTALDPQNLLLSGGFSDMGSLVKLEDLKDSVQIESYFYCVKKILNATEILLESRMQNTSNLEERKTYLNGRLQCYISEELVRKAHEFRVKLPNSIVSLLGISKKDVLKNYFDMG